MKKSVLILIACISAKAFAQIPEDALRYSWFPQNATARDLGAGGVMGSLGGDLSAAYVNPAGIGFFRVNEAVISPAFILNNSKNNYRGSTTTSSRNAFGLGPIGVILAAPNRYNNNKSYAVAISFTQNANFNNHVQYSGLNNYSSYAAQFAEEFSSLNMSIHDVLTSNSVAPYTVAPALYTYLIDTVTVNGNTIVKAAPEYILDAGGALRQQMDRVTKGGLYELNLAYGGNDGKKLLWGGSIGIPLVNFSSNTVFSESDTSANAANRFQSFSFTDNYTTKGAGLNARIGIIYRPQDYIRLGFAVHTPSFFVLTDSRETMLHSVVENPVFDTTVSSKLFANGQRGEAKYDQSSPWRAILSASYVFREIADVTKQRGFISADAEYVNNRGSRFSSDADQPTEDDKNYFSALNSTIKNIYKGSFNFRVGGELKFNTIMGRLGFGYYGNPYKDAPVKANKMTLSSGLGYRDKGFFIDLAYVYLITKDFDVPYRLSGAQNVYAGIRQTRGNIAATVGVKF